MTVSTVTRSASETGLLAQRVGALLRAGDVVVLAGDLGVGKTVFAKGVALALGITEPVVSPSFTIVRQYEGSLPLVHVDVYRIDHLQELYDIGFEELVGDENVTLVEWGDRVSAMLPADRLEVTIAADADDDDTRHVQFDGVGRAWSAAARRARRGDRVLILGIETATSRVSVAVGDADAVRGEVHLAGGRRHAEQLAPAVQYLCRELDVELGQVTAIVVGLGPGLFTGLRVGVTTAKVMAQTLRIPVVGVPSLDLVAYPLRHSHRLLVTVLDARRHEVFHAVDRPVPGGVQRVSEYEVGTPADLIADLSATDDELLLAGDGVARYGAEFAALDHVELAGAEFAWPSAAALVELAAARVQREEFEAPWDVHPMYLRQSDAEIEWDRRATS